MGVLSSAPTTRLSLLLRIRDSADAASWQTFVDLYGPVVYRYCRGRGLQDADAAEVMQEVLLEVSRSARKLDYDPARGRFRSWLGAVAHSKLYRWSRQKRRAAVNGTTADIEILNETMTRVQVTAWTEAFHRHILQAALARIRPRFAEATWQAFERVWLENRPAAEVAEELGQSVDWLYVAKSRVLKQLRLEIRELAEDAPQSFC